VVDRDTINQEMLRALRRTLQPEKDTRRLAPLSINRISISDEESKADCTTPFLIELGLDGLVGIETRTRFLRVIFLFNSQLIVGENLAMKSRNHVNSTKKGLRPRL
jgi:hypothetical protein